VEGVPLTVGVGVAVVQVTVLRVASARREGLRRCRLRCCGEWVLQQMLTAYQQVAGEKCSACWPRRTLGQLSPCDSLVGGRVLGRYWQSVTSAACRAVFDQCSVEGWCWYPR
jgi:hypothetical protein